MLLFLVVYPAFEALRFSLGLAAEDNVTFATGMHVVVSDTPTFEVYQTLFDNDAFVAGLRLTAFVTVVSVFLVLVVGYVLALYVRFGRGRLPSTVRTLYLIPMFVPVVISSYALITFYVDHGELQSILNGLGVPYTSPVYGAVGIIIGQVWVNIPFAVLLLGSGLDGLPQEMVEAAHDVGAGFFQVLWRIVLPLNVVPTLIVATFTFIGVLGSFTVPYLIGPNAPQMIGVAMQAYFNSYRQPQAAVAMAVMTFVAAATAGAIYVWATARSGRTA